MRFKLNTNCSGQSISRNINKRYLNLQLFINIIIKAKLKLFSTHWISAENRNKRTNCKYLTEEIWANKLMLTITNKFLLLYV